MRIPLDYYRILGLPIQATVDQLQQAHRDRALQLPRREYSEAAISARKQLLDEAYSILSDFEQRQAYDASFLAKTYDLEPDRGTSPAKPGSGESAEGSADPYTPSIEIQDGQLVGALLILLELGEYELVLKLGRAYLSNSIGLKNGRFGEPDIVLADIVLTVALACLELGREQWQQGQYENAAESLEAGQELLLREGLFATVRGEIQADLYKLRPYRVLELLALSESNVSERRQGLRLLREMLQERGGIDGTGTDQSGLNIDDFLRFIQQLRSYLTAAEQQVLFEEEARRPSAVATYLAVYALLGRGFAQRQPALIRRAKTMLMRLGSRQDVHLEQAVCALLLGQTEEASRALELSHEYEPLAFIREHSQGSPDLLPGLCLYSERWLQEEVFPHFRDLAQQKVTLKDYFADEQVQAYLEELPNEPGPTSDNEWVVSPSQQYRTNGHAAASNAAKTPLPTSRDPGATSVQRSAPTTRSQHLSELEAAALARRTPGNSAVYSDRAGTAGVANMPAAVRVVSEPEQRSAKSSSASEVVPPGGNSAPDAASSRTNSRTQERSRGQVVNGFRVPDIEDLPPRRADSGLSRSPSNNRWIWLVVLGLLGMGVLGYLTTKAYSWISDRLQGGPAARLEGEQLMVQLDRPPVAIPDPNSTLGSAEGPVTNEIAQQLIQSWLVSKAEALGPNHAINSLNQILVEPALGDWQKRAEEAKRDNWYRQYKHSNLVINAVEMSDVEPNQARIEAEVTESAELVENGQANPSYSYNETLRVRYDLVRQDRTWKIRDMLVLE